MTILVSVLLASFIHPFHVSVSEIKYKEDQKALQISTRLFLDDLERALRAYSNDAKLDITEVSRKEFVDKNLKNYLLSHIKLWDEKGKPYELIYVGSEIEGELMWCYLEIKKVKKPKQVSVQNSLLHETWKDQENLVHFRAYGEVKSARLYRGKEKWRFDWSD